MPAVNPKIYCIIPAWNEQGSIADVVAGVTPKVDRVVVVDDGSTDRTAALAAKAGATVLTHPINRGQGAALETGNRFAVADNADIIVHFDADGQFLPREIPDMVRPVAEGRADIVFGSRFLGKESQMPATKRYIIMPLARLVNLILFHARLTDPQSGFRSFSARVAGKIAIEQDDMAHCSEIIGKAFAHKLRIQEAPITVIFNDYGSGLRRGIKIIKDHMLAKLMK